MLTVGQLLTVLDSMAAGVAVFDAAMGATGAEAGTVSYGASRNIATLTAINDAAVQSDLVAAFMDRLSRTLSINIHMAISARQIQRALDAHLASSGGLSEFLKSNAVQAHYNLTRIGLILDPDVVFSPVAVDPMATFVLSGPGAGVFTPAGSIDPSQFGDAQLAVRTLTVIGGSNINATIHTLNRAGVDSAQIIQVPAGSAINARVALPTRGIQVSSISVTGGTAADQFKVVSEVERAVAL